MSKATSSSKATPAPDTVGVSFVKQYYHVMQTLPDLMYKFYKKYANWTYEDASNGTNLKAKGIDDFLKKWKSCPTRGATTDFSRNGHLMFQEINSSDNVSRGIFIMVHGEMTMDGQSASRMFQQSFLLEKEGDKGYSLTNDCFRFLPPVASGTAAAPAAAATTTAVATKKSVVSKPTKKKQAPPAAAPTSAAPATSAPVATKTTPPPTVAAAATAAPTPTTAATPAQQSTKSKKGKPRTKGKPAASNNKKPDTTPATESTGPSKPKTWASMATGPTTTAFKPLRKGPTAPNTTTNTNGGNNGNNGNNNNNNGNSNNNNNSGNNNNGNNNSGNNNNNNNNNNGKKEGRSFEPGKATHSLYVTGCPDGVTDKQVRDVFAPFGHIKEVVLQKGYIFVVYKDSVSAGKALEQRDRLKISNRTLKVDRKSSTKGGKNNNKGGNGKSGKQRNRGGGRGGRGGNKGGNKGGNNGDSKK